MAHFEQRSKRFQPLHEGFVGSFVGKFGKHPVFEHGFAITPREGIQGPARSLADFQGRPRTDLATEKAADLVAAVQSEASLGEINRHLTGCPAETHCVVISEMTRIGVQAWLLPALQPSIGHDARKHSTGIPLANGVP